VSQDVCLILEKREYSEYVHGSDCLRLCVNVCVDLFCFTSLIQGTI